MSRAKDAAGANPIPEPFALTSQEAAAMLAISIDSLDKLRKDQEVGWIQGVHWQKLPYGGIRYNAALLKDWFTNAHDASAHLRAVEAYMDSLLSSRKRRR